MLIADRYIGKQIISTTLFAVLIVSGVFLLGNIFKEARPLFVGKHPSALLVLQFIISVLPFSLIFTIPFSFLAAIMLIFGRLSSNNEITAMRMAGLSIPRIAVPVYLIAILLSALCFWLNVYVAPRAKGNVKNILLEAVKEDPNKFLDPGVVQTNLENHRIYVRERKGDILYGVHIHNIDESETDFNERGYTYAEKAHLFIDMQKGFLQLKMVNATMETVGKNNIHTPISIGEIDPVIFNFNLDRKRSAKSSQMTNSEITQYLEDNPNLPEKKQNEFKHQITHRQSYSFACLAFAIVGVPLGMTSRRRDTSSGFLFSIIVGLSYFLFHIFANESSGNSGMTPTILYWTPNVLALLLGLFLLRKARRK